jgi:hypothetical protein
LSLVGLLPFASKPFAEPALFFVREPGRVGGFVRKHEQHEDAEQYGRHPFDHKKPLPAAHAHRAIEFK